MTKCNHTPVREQDEFYCPKCGCRWGQGEDIPNVYVPLKFMSKNELAEKLSELRKELD